MALLVIDATMGVTPQDQRLAERVDAAGCPVVVLLNKWELLDAEAHDDLELPDQPAARTSSASRRCCKISALTGKGVHRLLPALAGTIDDYHRRVPTRKVNEVLRAAQAAQPAPHGGRVLYATQGATDPPTFTLFANKELPAAVPALPRALPPRGLRHGLHPHQAPGPQARLTPSPHPRSWLRS